MRLVTKLTFAFLLVLVPIGVGGWMLVDNTQAAFEKTFEDRVTGIERGVQERLKGVATELERALDRIADDPIVTEQMLMPMVRNVFYQDNPDIDYQRAIMRDARRLMTSAVLDTLRIVDLDADPKRRGQIIAFGHRSGHEETDAELIEIIEKHPESAFFRHERIENEKRGSADPVWTLQVAHVVGGGPGMKDVRVALVGGRIVDRRLVEDLKVVSGERTAIVLDDTSGRRVAATFEGAEPEAVEGGYTTQSRPMRNPTSPEPVANLRVYVPRTELVQWREALWTTAAIIAGAVVGVALLLGFFVARRMSKPLEALARAAADVALGHRDRDVPVPRGNDEVAQLTRAFNQMTHDLVRSEDRLRQSERVAAWREIARRIAHEIKNPLSPIQMSIEMLKKVWDRKHPDFEKIFHESTATILEEVGRMKRIVSEFSDFARMPSPRPVPTDLGELAAGVVTLVRETAPTVDVVVHAAPDLVVRLDPDQWRQALLNLTKNAIEAVVADRAGAGRDRVRGNVEVRVEPDGQRGVRVVVTDNGAGMSAETKKKLFTPYYTTKAAGTGLGLAIVHRIVEEHEGSIQVDSELGVGTRFVVRVPLTPSPG